MPSMRIQVVHWFFARVYAKQGIKASHRHVQKTNAQPSKPKFYVFKQKIQEGIRARTNEKIPTFSSILISLASHRH